MLKCRLAIFASGRGSNALNLIAHFENHPEVEIAFVLANKADAPIVEAAREQGVNVLVCSNTQVEETGYLTQICREHEVSHIVLAGFLRKIPGDFVNAYANRIINIHPSLLPKYGGTGMYGNFVHQAVLQNRESETGISIHLVNEEYDRGTILAQYSCELTEEETLESIQQKIHRLEMEHFPAIVEQVIRTKTEKT